MTFVQLAQCFCSSAVGISIRCPYMSNPLLSVNSPCAGQYAFSADSICRLSDQPSRQYFKICWQIGSLDCKSLTWGTVTSLISNSFSLSRKNETEKKSLGTFIFVIHYVMSTWCCIYLTTLVNPLPATLYMIPLSKAISLGSLATCTR